MQPNTLHRLPYKSRDGHNCVMCLFGKHSIIDDRATHCAMQVVGRAEPHSQTMLHPHQDRVVSILENKRIQVRDHA